MHGIKNPNKKKVVKRHDVSEKKKSGKIDHV